MRPSQTQDVVGRVFHQYRWLLPVPEPDGQRPTLAMVKRPFVRIAEDVPGEPKTADTARKTEDRYSSNSSANHAISGSVIG